MLVRFLCERVSLLAVHVRKSTFSIGEIAFYVRGIFSTS